MNINWDEQYALLEMDEAWDEYLTSCLTLGIHAMSFSEWKKCHK